MGPFDRFTDRAKRVLALSQDEAIRFNHNYIGTEHLLMGLVREGEGVAARVLDSLGIGLSKVRTSVELMIGRGPSTTAPSEITLSPGVKRVIELANEEAKKLGHGHTGTEHLLLGLVLHEDEKCPAKKVLDQMGVNAEAVRSRVIDTLARPGGATDGTSRTSPASPRRGPFDRFDESAKRVLALAQDEAIRLNHNYIGTEHLLAGLARHGVGAAARALESLGIELTRVRTALEFIIGRGDTQQAPSDLTMSPRTKKVLELAIDEADRMKSEKVSANHILLGLVREGEGIASGIIQSLKVELPVLRQKILDAMREEKPGS